MHKKNNKLASLLNKTLNERLHKAPRFVQSFAIARVFNDSALNRKGSSALIVIYKTGLTSMMMQKLAKHNRHPVTVFLNAANIKKHHCSIRWFNHSNEIQRCGHGTLAAALFLQKRLGVSPKIFYANSKEAFKITTQKQRLQLELSCITSQKIEIKSQLQQAITAPILQLFKTAEKNGYTTAIIDNIRPLSEIAVDIKKLQPYPNALILLQHRQTDNQNAQWHFRYFAPHFGVNEDSATGSAVSIIAPIIKQLAKQMQGSLKQDSAAGAIITYQLKTSSVIIS